MVKSYSFYSYNLNDGKFEYIENYVIRCVEYKNILSEYTSNNLLFDMFFNKNNWTAFKFIQTTKHLREKDINAQIFQQIQKEVYTMYMNRIDISQPKIIGNSLTPYIKYIVKSYKRNLEEYKLYLCDRFNETNDQFYDEVYTLIEKFGSRLLNLAIRLQDKMLDFKLNFHSLTTPIINNIGSKNQDIYMYEIANRIKIANGVIILNLGKKIYIPFKYNKQYHGDLMDYNFSQNSKTKQKQYSCILKLEGNRVRIIATKETNDTLYNFEEVTESNSIGVDTNLKHNIFALSDGKSIQPNKKFIKQCNKIIEKQAQARKTKDEREIENKTNGKKLQKQIKKQTRRVKAYIDYVCYLLVKYCRQHGFTNIVMEDLNISSKMYNKNPDEIKYSRLKRFLHINDIKNVITRIANKYDINVHFVNAEYTSQTCSICGSIDKKNRLEQETFCCSKCKSQMNADYNAAINILNRVINPQLRNCLERFEDFHYVGRFTNHRTSNKQIYIDIYNLICNNTNNFLM